MRVISIKLNFHSLRVNVILIHIYLIPQDVEHVFGFIENSMGGKFIRTIGIARAKVKIGFINLIYNVCRYEQLCRIVAP